MMTKVFLMGYMGSGKTTLGKKLATLLNYDFVDLDKKIEQKHQMSIVQIFKSLGEEGMRQWEQEALYECQNLQNTVISLGGGTPCFFDNLNFIQNNGIAVYLKMPAKMLMSRLLHSKTDRPLLQGKSKSELLEYVQQQLGERERYYLRAHLIFPASSPQVSELSQLIKNFQSENISK